MRICDYHKQDNKSVLDLPTPLELYKMEHTAEEYDELVSFYSSDEWKEVEREHLNSDRRYYEKRKALIDPEEKEVSAQKKYYEPEPFQLRAEEKFSNGFDDLFEDPVLQCCYRELTERQQKVISVKKKSLTCSIRLRRANSSMKSASENATNSKQRLTS